MDPLSITVSIITLLGVGGSISNAFEKLATLQHAPDALLALNNEISSLQFIVLEANSVLQDHRSNNLTGSSQESLVDNLLPILNRIKARLLELESLIEYRLTTPGLIGEERVRRLPWMRAQPKIKAIQDEIRSSRLDLVATVGLLTLKVTSRMELRVSELQFINSNLQMQQNQSHVAMAQSMACQRNIDRTIPEVLQNQERMERTLNELLHNFAAGQGEQARSQQDFSSAHQTRTSPSGGDAARWIFQLQTMRKPKNITCTSECSCCCHHRHNRKSASGLQFLFGILFVGYTGVPLISSCDSKSCCQKSELAVNIRYYFPDWFLTRVLDLYFQRIKPGGLAASLRVYRTVSFQSPVFNVIDYGDVADIEALLTSRQASPFDVACSGSGVTPLYYALLSDKLDFCRLLLNAGADPHYENNNQRSSYQLAWDSILRDPNTPRAETIRSLFPNPDLESHQFNSLHEGLLGLGSLSLEEASQRNLAVSINEGDKYGRTPLNWSAVRNDPMALEFLLRKGADVHKADKRLLTPLHSATASGSYSCARLLLQYGSEVNCLNSAGWAPIHWLTTNHDDTNLLDLLVSYQADFNVLNTSNSSPLKLAIEHQNFRVATKLIQLGANVHPYTGNGFNALSMAIWRNAHSLLKAILQKGADHTIQISNYGSILHWTAQHANIDTLRILTASPLSPRDVSLKRHDGLTATDVGRQRADFGPEWLDHFSAFLRSLNPIPIPQPVVLNDSDEDYSSGEVDVFEDALES